MDWMPTENLADIRARLAIKASEPAIQRAVRTSDVHRLIAVNQQTVGRMHEKREPDVRPNHNLHKQRRTTEQRYIQQRNLTQTKPARALGAPALPDESSAPARTADQYGAARRRHYGQTQRRQRREKNIQRYS